MPEPSTQFPTREYLNNNFTKAALQKRCRELGLTKIWVTKYQLISMIIDNTQSINDSQINAPHNTYAVSAPQGTQAPVAAPRSAAAAAGAAATPPLDVIAPPLDAVTPPVDGVTPPLDAVTPPMDDVTPPLDAVAPPLDAVTVFTGPVVAHREPVASPQASVATLHTTQTTFATPQASQAPVSAPPVTPASVAAFQAAQASDVELQTIHASASTLQATQVPIASPKVTQENIAALKAIQESLSTPQTTQELVTAPQATQDIITAPQVTKESVAAPQATHKPVSITQDSQDGIVAPQVTQDSVAATQDTQSLIAAPQALSPSSNVPQELHSWVHEGNQSQKIATDVETIINKLKVKDDEIELLNVEIKTAYTLIDLLMKRVDELEKKETNKVESFNRKANTQEEILATPNKCLLLGDTNLRKVRQSDLGDNCSVKTIPEANIDLLRSWVCEQLHIIPSECIIYCGLFDIIEGVSPENILSSIATLISDLRVKNNVMEISICQVAPVPSPQTLQCKIAEYNEHLTRWAELNGVKVIKTSTCHTLGTGEVDDLCFEKENKANTILSRLGIIRLLTTIKRYCQGFHLSKDWDIIKRDTNTLFARKTINTTHYSQHQQNKVQLPAAPSKHHLNLFKQRPTSPISQTPEMESHYNITYTPHFASEPSHKSISHSPDIPINRPQTPRTSLFNPQSLQCLNSPPTLPQTSPHSYASVTTGAPQRILGSRHGFFNHNGRADGGQSMNSYKHEDDKYRNRGNTQTTYSHTHHSSNYKPHLSNNTTHIQEHHDYRKQRIGSNGHQHQTRRVGCYNCGEFNHKQSTCRFDYKLRCELCHSLGHKMRLCHYYNR